MNKKGLTNRERLRKMLKGAEPGSVLSSELAIVETIFKKPKPQAVAELLQFLKPGLHSDTKWIVTWKLETANDERIIRPMMRAIYAPENIRYRSFFLWPLTKYDCTKHLYFFVNLIVSLEEPGEAMMVAIMIVRAMKGLFEPLVARKCIRKLLAEIKAPMDTETKLQIEAFRLEAADFIMAKYFNQIRKEFWQERGGSVTIS